MCVCVCVCVFVFVCVHLYLGAEITILQSAIVSPVAGYNVLQVSIIIIMCLRVCVGMCVCLPDVQIWGKKLYYVKDNAASINHDWHIQKDRVYTPTPLRLVSECNDLKFAIILWKSVATDSLSLPPTAW